MNFKKKTGLRKKMVLGVTIGVTCIVGILAVDFIIYSINDKSPLTSSELKDEPIEEIKKEEISTFNEDNSVSNTEEDKLTINDVEEQEEVEEKVFNEKKENINVFINEEVINDNGKIRLKLNSNLPDGSELMITLSGKNTNYIGQNKVVLKNGEAESEEFSNRGEAMESGEYNLSISLSLARLQSDEVRAVIGEDGEYLTGNIVKKSSIADGNVVDMEKVIRIK